MPDQLKILAAIPNPQGAVSYYRGVGPLSALCKQYQHVQYTLCNPYQDYQWCDIVDYDILFVIRPETQQQINLIRLAKELDIKVWIDFDDLLWGIPPSHPLHFQYRDRKLQSAISQAMHLADKISFSTQYLYKDAMEHYKLEFDKCTVLYNAIDTAQIPKHYTGGEKVLWRGGPTHEHDLISHKEQLIALSQKHTVVFYGHAPYQVIKDLPNHEVITFSGLMQYFRHLKEENYAFMYVPLEDNPFNRAKSSIAALEALLAGTLAMAPAWEEWENVALTGSRKDMFIGEAYALCRRMAEGKHHIHTVNQYRYQLIEEAIYA